MEGKKIKPKVFNKKVLIITYYWPPSGGSGVQRWMYFAKYLKRLGWKPYVVTVDEKKASYSVIDITLQEEVKIIPTIKTKTREPLRWYSFLTTSSFKKGIPQGEIKTQSVFGKFTSFIRGNFFIPDARKGWRPYALKASRKLIDEEKITRVITTGPPHSCHWVGFQLKKEFGIKWFVDFRDPWSSLFYNHQFYQMPWAIKEDKNQEKRIISQADTIITTVGGAFHHYLKTVAPKQNFHFIPNGYDAELMDSIPNKKQDKVHIVFTGLLTENQLYDGVLLALEKLQDKYTIRFSLAGQISEKTQKKITALLHKVELNFLGYISHFEAIVLMKSGDLLLNFIFNGAYNQMISGKLLEYIATEVPILSIGDPDSEAGKFIKQGSYAEMILSENKNEIYDFILNAIDRKGKIKNEFPGLHRYTRKETAIKLIQILS